jgi:hypothetical protein
MTDKLDAVWMAKVVEQGSVRLDAASRLPDVVDQLNQLHPDALVAYASMIRVLAFLSDRYRRLARRRGKKRAIIAVGNSVLTIIWHLLTDPGARDHDLGPSYHDAKINQQRRQRDPTRQLEHLTGQKVILQPGRTRLPQPYRPTHRARLRSAGRCRLPTHAPISESDTRGARRPGGSRLTVQRRSSAGDRRTVMLGRFSVSPLVAGFGGNFTFVHRPFTGVGGRVPLLSQRNSFLSQGSALRRQFDALIGDYFPLMDHLFAFRHPCLSVLQLRVGVITTHSRSVSPTCRPGGRMPASLDVAPVSMRHIEESASGVSSPSGRAL